MSYTQAPYRNYTAIVEWPDGSFTTHEREGQHAESVAMDIRFENRNVIGIEVTGHGQHYTTPEFMRSMNRAAVNPPIPSGMGEQA